MPISTKYPTGTDYHIYLSDALQPESAEEATALPDFDNMKPLDVKNITVVEDGQITPLYHISRQTADHFCYSRKQINGNLNMNFSEDYMRRHRSPLQDIRDKTMWVVLDYVDWRPMRRVKDIYRIGAVWEHPFRHEPQPHAAEQIPFTARDLALISRKTALFDVDEFDRFTQGEQRTVQANDLFRARNNRYLGTVDLVEDGDSLDVTIDSTGKSVTIRLAGTDTPEKDSTVATKAKSNPVRYDYTAYRWPSDAPRPTNYSGDESAAKDEQKERWGNDVSDWPVQPTQSQLDQWGRLIRDHVKHILPQGSKVWVVTDQGTAPQGEFGRYVFRIDFVQPVTTKIDVPNGGPTREVTSTNLGKHLVKLGYTEPYNSDSIAETGGQYRNLSSEIREMFRGERQKAGTEEANGIFYHPDPDQWRDALTINL